MICTTTSQAGASVKSSEQQLHEWAAGEITFDSGGAYNVFTNEAFKRLADALSTGAFGDIAEEAEVPDARLRDWQIAWNLHARKRSFPKVSAQWLLQFSSILEAQFVLMNLLEADPEKNTTC